MKSKSNLILLFVVALWLLTANNSLAQQLQVTGTVTEKSTTEPVAHAHVRVGDVITYTNAEGEFVIKVPQSTEDRLEVFHMGYDTYNKRLNPENSPYRVILEQLKSDSTISEGVTGSSIMREVFNRFHTNYDMDDQLMLSYYKETLTDNDELHYIAEGIMEVHLPSNVEDAPAMLRPIKTRVKTVNNIKHRGVDIKSGHASEMVQSSIWLEKSFLSDKNRCDYKYTLIGEEVHRDEDIYILEFEPAKSSGYVFGKIYIDAYSYAIIRIEYYPALGAHWDDEYWVEEFQHHDYIYYLLRASYEGHWIEGDDKYVFRSIIINTEVESNADDSIPWEQFLPGKEYTFHTDDEGNFTDDFWGQYNFIKLDASEAAVLRK